MTNATKTLTIIFVSLLVLTGLVKWLGDSTSSQAFRTRLVNVDTARVSKIVIESPTQDRTITLNKKENDWSVLGSSSGETYPADNGSVKRAIQQLNELNVKAVATRDSEKYTRFKVDSTGTRVSLYNNDNLLSDIYVGAPQIVSRQQFNSYVRPADDDAVYTVEGFLGSTFGKDLDGWREKTVWEVDRNTISRIDFLFPADSSYSIERVGENEWISDGDTLSSGSVRSITNRLGSLRAGGFVDSLSVDSFGNELYAIQLQIEGDGQKTLRLKLPEGESANFQAVASDYPYVFTLNKSSFENSVLKPRQELLEE